MNSQRAEVCRALSRNLWGPPVLLYSRLLGLPARPPPGCRRRLAVSVHGPLAEILDRLPHVRCDPVFEVCKEAVLIWRYSPCPVFLHRDRRGPTANQTVRPASAEKLATKKGRKPSLESAVYAQSEKDALCGCVYRCAFGDSSMLESGMVHANQATATGSACGDPDGAKCSSTSQLGVPTNSRSEPTYAR